MSLVVSTKYRSHEEEIMDDLDYNGPILHDALDKLAKINRWLGGNKVTINGLKKALKNHPKTKPITIVDLGCGGGDILREVSRFGKKNNYNFQLIGIDANPNTVGYADKLSQNYDNIKFQAIDVFSEEFNTLKYDLVLTTLFLHHFKTSEITQIMHNLVSNAKVGAVVNDLQRNRLAFFLFRLFSFLFLKTKIAKHDGLVSVARGFLRKEIESIAKDIKTSKSQLHWKWAFRYQWILIR